jgi:ribosomal protein S18 acetylase RimI-like enzyme
MQVRFGKARSSAEQPCDTILGGHSRGCLRRVVAFVAELATGRGVVIASERRLLIRHARASDIDVIRAIVRAAYAVYVPRIGREPAPMSADYPVLVQNGVVWVAELDRSGPPGPRVVGVLVLEARGAELLLENVAVAPRYQRKGIGRALIAFAEDRARRSGLPAITLYTNERMIENIALYERLGYEEVGRGIEAGFARVFFRKVVDPSSADAGT